MSSWPGPSPPACSQGTRKIRSSRSQPTPTPASLRPPPMSRRRTHRARMRRAILCRLSIYRRSLHFQTLTNSNRPRALSRGPFQSSPIGPPGNQTPAPRQNWSPCPPGRLRCPCQSHLLPSKSRPATPPATGVLKPGTANASANSAPTQAPAAAPAPRGYPLI